MALFGTASDVRMLGDIQGLMNWGWLLLRQGFGV